MVNPLSDTPVLPSEEVDVIADAVVLLSGAITLFATTVPPVSAQPVDPIVCEYGVLFSVVLVLVNGR